MEKEELNIISLPNEIILSILQYINYADIVNFGLTCKSLHHMIIHDQCLWKNHFKALVPADTFSMIENCSNQDWYTELIKFCSLKREVHSTIMAMSKKFYWLNNELKFEDVKYFFDIALKDRLSYYYAIHILQDLIRIGNQNLDKNIGIRPYTLTECYYAKFVVRHLIHCYMTIKWVQTTIVDEMTPTLVVNFFLQWVDTEVMHRDEDFEFVINKLTEAVRTILYNKYVSKALPVKEKDILNAISYVIYKQEHIEVSYAANLVLLDIIQIYKNKCGNMVAVASMYQAVATKFGLKSELISFPNHLFLQWKSSDKTQPQVEYTIHLETGELQLKRRCPFSNNSNYPLKYSPDSLIRLLYSSFNINIGPIKNWNTESALFLIHFLNNSMNHDHPYIGFLSFLWNYRESPALQSPLTLRYLSDEHMQLLHSLVETKIPNEISTFNEEVSKIRDSRVSYAVGMLCYHRELEYVCIIRDWELSCTVDADLDFTEYTTKQPYYVVVVADRSVRYVAQDMLMQMPHPRRLHHLESQIARGFTHFDGFSYVANAEKRAEYPRDAAAAAATRARASPHPHAPSRSAVLVFQGPPLEP